MARKPGFIDYITAAFNARPIGMFVAPNWIGLAAFGLLGVTNPGFWVLGAGLELGYLLTLATNKRFQNTVSAKPLNAAMMRWFFDKYLRGPEDGQTPAISLNRAADLSGLPPASGSTCGTNIGSYWSCRLPTGFKST